MDAQSKKTVPVLIVGGGPVGLSLACDLGWRGVECLLIERGDGTIEQPKTNEVNIRTMEFCRRWGIVDTIEARGYSRDHPHDQVYCTNLTGYELSRHPIRHSANNNLLRQALRKKSAARKPSSIRSSLSMRDICPA